jgi:hypothetical protein
MVVIFTPLPASWHYYTSSRATLVRAANDVEQRLAGTRRLDLRDSVRITVI